MVIFAVVVKRMSGIVRGFVSFASLSTVIGLENSRHSFNRWYAKLIPTWTWSIEICRATAWCLFFLWISSAPRGISLLVGSLYHFGLVSRHSTVRKRSIFFTSNGICLHIYFPAQHFQPQLSLCLAVYVFPVYFRIILDLIFFTY